MAIVDAACSVKLVDNRKEANVGVDERQFVFRVPVTVRPGFRVGWRAGKVDRQSLPHRCGRRVGRVATATDGRLPGDGDSSRD
jgi:hypothetical protein